MPHAGDLWRAIASGNTEKALELIRENPEMAKYRNPNANEETPLHKAVSEGNPIVAEVLLENGVDINAPDESGETPLHKAAWYGNPEMVSFLLEHGADVNARNCAGKTPLFSAMEVDYQYHPYARIVQQILLDAGADKEMNIFDSARIGDVKKVEQFLDADPELLDSRDEAWYNYTPLLHAADMGEIKVAEFLLSKGADIDAADTLGHTSILLAIEQQHKELEEYLRSKGAWEPEGGWFPGEGNE